MDASISCYPLGHQRVDIHRWDVYLITHQKVSSSPIASSSICPSMSASVGVCPSSHPRGLTIASFIGLTHRCAQSGSHNGPHQLVPPWVDPLARHLLVIHMVPSIWSKQMRMRDGHAHRHNSTINLTATATATTPEPITAALLPPRPA